MDRDEQRSIAFSYFGISATDILCYEIEEALRITAINKSSSLDREAFYKVLWYYTSESNVNRVKGLCGES